MTGPEELLALAKRVEAERGHDIVIDTAVCVALQYVPSPPGVPIIGHDSVPGRLIGSPGTEDPDFHRAPALTISLDAVEALRQQLQIGGTLISIGGGKTWKVSIMLGDVDFDGDATTEPRARLAALLRACASMLER